MKIDDLEAMIRKVNINFRLRFFMFKNKVGYEIICLMRDEEPPLRIGRFGKDSPKKDGSEIVVFQKYRHHAEEYAKLYKNLTGKEVNIILSDRLNQDGCKVKDSEDKQESSEGRPEYINPFEIEVPELNGEK